jgi:hypothetical protein
MSKEKSERKAVKKKCTNAIDKDTFVQNGQLKWHPKS